MSTVKGHAPLDSVMIYGTTGTIKLDCVNYDLFMANDKSDLKKINIPSEFQSSWRVEEEFLSLIHI